LIFKPLPCASPDFSLRPDGMTRLNNEFFVIGLYQNLTVPSMFEDVYFSKVSKSYEIIWTKKIGSNWDRKYGKKQLSIVVLG
jgi:hypothetical protein